MDYNELFYSICEIITRVPKKMDWNSPNINVYYHNKSYNPLDSKYHENSNKFYVVDRITLELSEFDYFKFLIENYDTPEHDKEEYLIKCLHSIIVNDLVILYPEIINENYLIYYRYNENIYPLLITRKFWYLQNK